MTFASSDALPAPVDAEFVIAADHPCLPGHFPGRPVVPGVVVLDQVLAAAETLLGAVPATLRIPQVKFVRPLSPDEPAHLRLEPVRGADGGLRLKFRVGLRMGHTADVAGETIASGELALPTDAGADAGAGGPA